MQIAHVQHQHIVNFCTCALRQNWRHWFSTPIMCKTGTLFFLCGYEEHTFVEYVHEMYETHTINTDYVIIQEEAAIFLFASSIRNGLRDF